MVLRRTDLTWLRVSLFGIPFLNGIADATTNYFSAGLASPGAVRLGIIAALAAFGIVSTRGTTRLGWLSLLLFTYFGTRAGLSSDPTYAFVNSFSKFGLPLVLFAGALGRSCDDRDLLFLMLGQAAGALAILGQFALSQVLGIGESVYVEDSFYLGGAVVQTTYNLGVFAIMSPFARTHLRSATNRSTLQALGLVGLMALLLIFFVFRRGTVLGIVLAGGALMLGRGSVIGRLASVVLPALAIVAVLALSPLGSSFEERLTARSLDERPLTEEARYFETFEVFADVMSRSAADNVFGREMFNSTEYFGVVRQLHIDWNIILHGGGLLGLALVLLWYGSILRALLARSAALTSEAGVMLVATGVGLLLFSLAVSISGSVTSVGYRANLLLSLAVLIRFRGSSDAAVTP